MNTDDILSRLPPEAAALVKEARQRFSSPEALNTWLLTPISPGGKRPIDHLIAGEHAIFRSFLQRVQTGQEMFRILSSGKQAAIERPRERLKDAMKRLKPYKDGG
ncbi:MAG TPA: hypothetical protein VFQ30_17315 [Ktedonobacteraceae bacterium]|nr:hypothetical protein [Ktedonobacteraceae bacterium]